MVEKNFKVQKLSENIYVLDIIRTDLEFINIPAENPEIIDRHVFILSRIDLNNLQNAISKEIIK